MTWIASLPGWLLVLGWLAVALVVVGLARLAVHAMVPPHEREGVQRVVGPLMPALAATFAVLMGLTLASEAGYLKSAQDTVSAEAAAASRLAWAATSPGVDADGIQSALADYLRLTREDEWSGGPAASGDDPGTRAALARLEVAVRTEAVRPGIVTPVGTELLTSLDGLSSGRRARIAAGDRDLPALYVWTLIVSGIALVANAGALVVGVSRRSALLVAGLAAVVGLSLALLFALSWPWRGPLVVSGQSIDQVVADLEAGFFS